MFKGTLGLWSAQSVSPSGATTPSRLARLAMRSRDWDHARSRARALYREWYRAAPEICQLYRLDVTPARVRAKVRGQFERNKVVNDLPTYDTLLHKNYMDYQETINVWKMEHHVAAWFDEVPPKPVTFMDKFLMSRDGNNVERTA